MHHLGAHPPQEISFGQLSRLQSCVRLSMRKSTPLPLHKKTLTKGSASPRVAGCAAFGIRCCRESRKSHCSCTSCCSGHTPQHDCKIYNSSSKLQQFLPRASAPAPIMDFSATNGENYVGNGKGLSVTSVRFPGIVVALLAMLIWHINAPSFFSLRMHG